MLTTLVLAFALPRILTFETRATRLPVILAQIQEQTGVKVSSEKSFANDVLIIRTEAVETQDLLDRIAFASVGKWRKEDDRLVLTPDIARRKEQESELAKRREKRVQDILNTLAKELEPTYDQARISSTIQAISNRDPQLDYYAQVALGRRGPLQRLAIRTLIGLGAKYLVSLKPGERIVFSNDPTPRQKAWPRLSQLLPDFYKEWGLYQEVKATAPEGQGFEAFARYLNGAVAPGTLDSVDRIWMSVSDLSVLDGTFSVSLGFARHDDSVTIGATLNLQMSRAPAEPVAPSETPDVALPLDEDSLNLSHAVQSTYASQRPPVDLKRELLAKLKDPMRYDPLSFGSEVYLHYAKARKLNLVVWINDNAFPRFLVGNTKAIQLRAFEASSRPNMVFSESPGWLVLAPGSPVEARRSRDDRQALAWLVTGIESSKRLTLEICSEYVLHRPYGIPEGIGKWLGLILDKTAPWNVLMGNEDLMRLYGSLSQSQRRALGADETLAYASFAPAQKLFIDRLIYGPRATSSLGAGLHRVRPNYPVNEGPSGDLEPTFSVPTGVPLDSPVRVSEQRSEEINAHSKDGLSMFYSFSVAELASQVFYEQNPELVEGDIASWFRPALFTVSERRKVRFEIDLGTALRWIGTLDDVRPVTGRVARDQLPESVKSRLAIELARLNEQKASGVKMKMTIRNSGSGRKVPPPKG